MPESTSYADMAKQLINVLGPELAGYAAGLPRRTKLDPERIIGDSVDRMECIYEVYLDLQGNGYSNEQIKDEFRDTMSDGSGLSVVMACHFGKLASVREHFNQLLQSQTAR